MPGISHLVLTGCMKWLDTRGSVLQYVAELTDRSWLLQLLPSGIVSASFCRFRYLLIPLAIIHSVLTATVSKSRHYTVGMYASATKVHLVLLRPCPLTSDLENLFSNAHSHDIFVAVSSKSLHWVQRYRITWNRCQRTDRRTDNKRTDGWMDNGRADGQMIQKQTFPQRPLTQWIFLTNFIEIPPLITEILHHTR